MEIVDLKATKAILPLFLFSLLVITLVSPVSAQESTDAKSQDKYVAELRRVENLNKKYEEKIAALEKKLAEKEQQLAAGPVASAPSQTTTAESSSPAQVREGEANDLLTRITSLNEGDENFRQESGKAHYNMGNIYYERGEYKRAAIEYFQAVDLMPYDPDSHFNLALVSGEFLRDYETALKHYQRYLYLKGNSAEDENFVREKMIAAQLGIRARIDSPLENEVKEKLKGTR